MGINKLHQLLKNQCPWVYQEVHLSEFAYQWISIDVSLFMCKYKSLSDNWLESFMNLIVCLRKNDIHCLFVFDSGHPPEKIDEREERMLQREKLKTKIEGLESALERYIATDVLDDELKSYLKEFQNSPKSVQVNTLRAILEKKKRALFTITPEDWDLLKNLFNLMKVTYYYAPLEAETMCADLCKRGIVVGALTEDTDVLAYGTKVFLTKLDIYSNTVTKIVYEDVLQGLKLSDSEFLDLCIMCGTDYNKNIPKVGCETAYKLIKQFGSIEEIRKQKELDISILKHERNRELFREYERFVMDEKGMKYNGQPDLEGLGMMIDVDVNRVKRGLKAKLIFKES